MKAIDTNTEKYMNSVIEYVAKIHGEAALLEMTTREGMAKYMKLYNEDYAEFVRKVLDAPEKAKKAINEQMRFQVWAKVNKNAHNQRMSQILN